MNAIVGSTIHAPRRALRLMIDRVLSPCQRHDPKDDTPCKPILTLRPRSPSSAAVWSGSPPPCSWPGAAFHNGQTMILGLLLGTLALVILFTVQPLTLPTFLIAAAVAGVYFLAMALAPLFPGTLWVDPEFEGVVPRRFGLNPQQFITYVLGAFWALAVIIAVVSSAHG